MSKRSSMTSRPFTSSFSLKGSSLGPARKGGLAAWGTISTNLGTPRLSAQNLGAAAGSVDLSLRRLIIESGEPVDFKYQRAAQEEVLFVLGGSGTCWLDRTAGHLGQGD